MRPSGRCPPSQRAGGGDARRAAWERRPQASWCWPSTRARRAAGRSSSTPPASSSRAPSRRSGLSTPQPGWVEQDAEELWQAQLATARAALEKAGVSASAIAGIGIANQRETTIVWDRATSQPVAPAIVWQDRRTAGVLRGAARRRRRGAGPAQDRPAARPVLLRHQAALAARQRPRRARARRGRRARLRHGRQLDGVAAQRRPPPRDRRDQRLADAALRHPRGRLGRRAAGALRRAAGAAARGRGQQRRGRASRTRRCSAPPCPSPAWPATSRRRSSARPARAAA